jgi:hypothetical protein
MRATHFFGLQQRIVTGGKRSVLLNYLDNQFIVAQIASGKLLDPTACGSWLNFVWFAEIDDQKPLTAFVSEALERIDWDQQASSFDY